MPISFPIPQKGIAKLEDTLELNQKFVLFKFELVTPHRLPFIAGQYVSLKVSAKGERRAYSIFSTPDIDHGFELLLDVTPAGVGTQFLRGLQYGQEVEYMGPVGRFVIETDRKDAEPNLVFIATGSGIVPLYSMIMDLLQKQQDTRPMVLYWGLRNEADLFYEMELAELSQDFPNFSFHPVISQPGPEWTLCQGRVTTCLTTHGVLEPAGYYICGSKEMVQDVTKLVSEAGVAAENIHFERFS